MLRMANYYAYFVSSLPGLRFGSKPPFPLNRLIDMAAGLLSDGDTEILKTISDGDTFSWKTTRPIIRKWQAFETALRNELVRIRAARMRVDPLKYMRHENETDIAINHMAINAYRAPNILESERMLDEARWRVLDELVSGHYFDLDVVLAYALKLSILEKWERIRSADKTLLLENAMLPTAAKTG